jgi:hypothetical protein
MKNIPFSFTETYSNTCPITSINSYTHTNSPLRKDRLQKGSRDSFVKTTLIIFWFQMDVIQKVLPSTLPGGRCLPGRTPYSNC